MINKFRSHLLSAAILLAVSNRSDAQSYQEEIYSGYQGGINKNLKLTDKSVNFIVMGDWGRMGGFHQKAVADQMGITAVTAGVDFVISVGDNFYPNGVQSVQDPQWRTSFENVYNSVNLHEDWIVALGNHDYRGNIQAQIDYSKISRRWKMPSAYYDTLIDLKGGKKLHLIVMDTNPFIEKYHVEANEHPQVGQQDTARQMIWLEDRLRLDHPDIQWKMVVGHHPLYSGGKRKGTSEVSDFEKRFGPIFEKYKVDAYITGHEHDLQVVRPGQGRTLQFLSGAASEVRPTGDTEGTKFAAAEPGFMLFSLTKDQLLVQVVRADGTVLYEHDVKKGK